MSDATHTESIPDNTNPARLTLVIAGMLSGAALLYYFQSTWAYLLELWTAGAAGEYAHGFLIVAVSGYLVFINRHALAKTSIQPTFWALPVIALMSIAWFLSQLIGIRALETIIVILLPLAMTWSLFGTQAARILLFPLGYLIFSIPAWGLLAPILQIITAIVSHAAISFAGIPALLEGYYITLPAGQFVVEEGCSGIRYFTVACAIGSLFAYLQYTRWLYRIAFFATMVGVAIAANWIRVIIVLYVGEKTAMESSLVHDHLTLGWIIFAVLVLPLFWFASQEPNRETTEPGPELASKPVSIQIGALLTALLILPALLVGPGLSYRQSLYAEKTVQFSPIFAETIGDWSQDKTSPNNERWRPVLLNADFDTLLTYRNEMGNVSIFIADYFQTEQDKELINIHNQIYGGEGWRPDTGTQERVSSSGINVVQTRLISASGEERLQWHWYVVGDVDTANQYAAKLLEAWKIISGNQHALFIGLSTALDSESTVRLEQALKEVWIPLERDLKQTNIVHLPSTANEDATQ